MNSSYDEITPRDFMNAMAFLFIVFWGLTYIVLKSRGEL